MENNKIGILLVGFNEAERIQKRIKDLEKIDIPLGCTLLIIDNGSYDNSFKIISNLKNRINGLDIIKHRIENNCGYTVAFNSGINILKEKKIDAVITLSLKAKPDKNWLTALTKEINESDALAFSGIELEEGDLKKVSCAGHCQERNGAIKLWGHGKIEQRVFDDEPNFEPFCACTTNGAFRMDLFERIGLMDTRYFQTYSCSDIGWRARIMIDDFKCKFVSDAKTSLEENHNGSDSERRMDWIIRRERNCVINLLKYAPEKELDNALLKYYSRERGDGTTVSLRKQVVNDVLENRNEWITSFYKFKDLESKKIEIWDKWIVSKCDENHLTLLK
jgi:GT2 family glycosyltransferase